MIYLHDDTETFSDGELVTPRIRESDIVDPALLRSVRRQHAQNCVRDAYNGVQPLRMETRPQPHGKRVHWTLILLKYVVLTIIFVAAFGAWMLNGCQSN